MGKEDNTDIQKLADLKPNLRLLGTVEKIELFGAFINVGIDTLGLVHISKVKRSPVNRIEDILQEGQEVEVWVQKVDANAKRLELTMIRPIELDWNNIKPGLKMKGKVVRLENFGAFVDIGAERPGLVHVSEMSSEYVADPSEILKIDDEIDVAVIDLDRKKRQIRLSIRAAEEIEEITDDDVEEEEPPTAMEVALRKAMDEEPVDAPVVEPSSSETKKTKDELEDILSRTLKQRVKTSTSEE
jgi:predicted RNA-binding protein with RPS1 domain